LNRLARECRIDEFGGPLVDDADVPAFKAHEGLEAGGNQEPR